jgi:signal transduction histidine kinase
MERASYLGSATLLAGEAPAPAPELAALRAEVERLLEAVELRDEFIAILGHELRNPLSTLFLHVQSLQLQVDADPEPRSRERMSAELRTIVHRVQRFIALLDRVFDASRIGSGQLSLKPEDVDLGAAVQDWVVSHEQELRIAECAVSCQLEPGVVGRWDRARLEQILDNLLGNAMRYGAGRPIEVQVGADRSHATLTVRDHGIGIDPADHKRIFERYVRADRGHRSPGLGLGLWLVDSICRAMGGSIALDSKLGSGATFVVRLPLA